MQTITMNALLELFIRKLKWLLLGLVCGAALLAAYTFVFVENTYTTSILLYVQNTEKEQGVVTTNNLYASRMLTNTYAVILQDVETIRLAAENMTVPATMNEIARSLRVETSEDSAVITLYVSSNDPAKAQAICQAICETAPAVVQDTIGAGVVTVHGNVPPAVKTGPNIAANTLLGAAGGLLLAALCVFIAFLADTTIRHKDDLSRVTALPVLGEIPTLKL